MNWGHFNNSVCYIRLPGVEVACWSLTQEIAGSIFYFFIFLQILRFCRNRLGKLDWHDKSKTLNTSAD